MASQSNNNSSSKNNKANATNIISGENSEVKPSTFHDFLGHKLQHGLESSTSDLGSERHVGNHLEGIPFYGSRGDVTGPESSNRFTGFKRSNSDSFVMTSRDSKFPQGPADSQDSPLLTKLLRYSGGERARRPQDDEPPFGMHHLRPISASFVAQSTAAGGRNDANSSKWDRAMPVNLGPTLQFPPRTGGQVLPFGYQAPSSNRFKDSNVSPSVIAQTAADEGSRTGIKGSGVLSSINALSGRQPSGVLIRSGKQKSGAFASEPESSTMPSQRGTEPAGGGQMTIFYGGKAHVFDNVHPNKADVIMSLAGSNGGSWSTTYKPNSGVRPSTGENCIPSGENDTGVAIPRELHGRPSEKGEPNRGFVSGHQPTRGSELSTKHD